jgi:hypothetical protein
MSDNELDGYYLVRAYNPDAEPFAVLTDLRENAADVCKKARPGIGAEKDYDYMKERAEVENWLRGGARAIGVDIRKENPVYFVLTRDPEAYAGYARRPMSGNSERAKKKVIAIPASEIDLSACSFTFDDSFPSYKISRGLPLNGCAGPRHPMNGLILNAKQTLTALKTYGEPKTDGMPHGAFRYIEVQMWDKLSIAAMPAARMIPPVKPAQGQGGPRP